MPPRLTQPRRFSRVSGCFWTASVANCQRNSRMFFGYPSRAIPKQCKFTLLSQPGKHLSLISRQRGLVSQKQDTTCPKLSGAVQQFRGLQSTVGDNGHILRGTKPFPAVSISCCDRLGAGEAKHTKKIGKGPKPH